MTMQAQAMAEQIYLAYAMGTANMASAQWMQTPDYLRAEVRKNLDQRIVACDNVHVFEQCVGWDAMATWLRDYQSHMSMDVVAQCPRILTAWWKKLGHLAWPSWAHQSLGSLLWLDVCNFLAAGHWHMWGSNDDHFVSHLTRYYEEHPHTLSFKQQEALKNQIDAFALTNTRFMAWLTKQAFYNPSWDDTLFMQTHNHHRHACRFDARLLNPHSRAVTYYINQLRTHTQEPFTDGYWFFPADNNPDVMFATRLIASCPDIAFYCNSIVDKSSPQYASWCESIALHQSIDPDLSMLLQWLHSNPVDQWGVAQESQVGPW